MNLSLNTSLVADYHSASQIARVLTESWMVEEMYCPRCGHSQMEHFPNNKPVADFYCPSCGNEYELKSKNGNPGRKITDGAYDTMIERITSKKNPDFFFMGYSKATWKISSLIFVPKFFFVPSIIEKRKPLAETAQRAGWVGCNILIDQIPEQGRIQVVSNGIIADRNEVVRQVQESKSLEIGNIDARGWLFDMLNCVNQIPDREFTLQEVYQFEDTLHDLHPQNNNIKPKIRQQLQVLRDRGLLDFLGNGLYRKKG